MLAITSSANAQLQSIKGQVIANDDVEAIHVLNKTSLKYTVTDSDGSFEILAKIDDTLTISSLKYNIKEVKVTPSILTQNIWRVFLTERITELDEVVVGKLLTGSLSSDMNNLEVETPVNFYDLGIPGYTGKQKILGERKLIEATTGGGIVPLFPIINAITGRTKRLKKQLQIERNILCVERLKDEYKNILFQGSDTPEAIQNQFFSYILDSENLKEVCKDPSKLNKVMFLQTALENFIALQEQKD